MSQLPFFHPEIQSTNPTLVPGNSSVAPGAENVGHAQILSAFSKPFELAGLFGTADAGAFGLSGDNEMMDADDDDGDVFLDAVEDQMDEDKTGR